VIDFALCAARETVKSGSGSGIAEEGKMTQALRVLIVDDEAPARNRICDLVADCAQQLPVEVAGQAENGRVAIEMLSQCNPDVVLLDIRMPEMDGFEVAQHIQHLDDPPAIIFTTAFDVYAVQAFEVHAIDYLVKPIRYQRLYEALSRASRSKPQRLDVLRELKADARTHLSVHERGRIHLIPVAEIAFLKADLKYVRAGTAQREYLLEEPLARLEQEFPERFVRIHRNCLVAKDAIRGFERVNDADGEGHWVVVLKDIPEKLAVSRRQHNIVRELRKPA
jgi:two-component system response regulator AlgR